MLYSVRRNVFVFDIKSDRMRSRIWEVFIRTKCRLWSGVDVVWRCTRLESTK
ncbi:hypothetical protein IF1G_07916 [Cordyceps javanica]|uniref:Uncharacterized protein n=1 Tax=Cordyceps javanica TaxID=43265 RepID=A0A545UV44_9HYPO|nr:hypothetical protein IF1G_07916 [Cordyceps javanica]TQW05310.1 hypothetical protein IF2G_07247 [Cordyceps javanica]